MALFLQLGVEGGYLVKIIGGILHDAPYEADNFDLSLQSLAFVFIKEIKPEPRIFANLFLAIMAQHDDYGTPWHPELTRCSPIVYQLESKWQRFVYLLEDRLHWKFYSRPNTYKKKTDDNNPNNFVCRGCWENVFSRPSFAKGLWAPEVRDKILENDGIDWQRDDTKVGLSFAAIVRSARRGCPWCQLIASDIEIDIFTWDKPADRKGVLHRTVCISVERSRKDYSDMSLFIDTFNRQSRRPLTVSSDPSDAAHGVVKKARIQSMVNTRHAFRQAQQWLHNCASHSECSRPHATILPDRVVAIESLDGNATSARLVNTNGDLSGYYTALSYCWGEEQAGVTTSASLASRLESIALDELSQTARDAINCTAKLGLRYLWIDALCIVQDDDADKEQQISKMQQVYSQSYVTIVALSPKTAAEGFLQARKVDHKVMRLPLVFPDGRLGIIYVSRRDFMKHSRDPLEKRAWSYQERMLAPRQLIYTSTTLQYLCRTSSQNLDQSDYGVVQKDHFRFLPLSHIQPSAEEETRCVLGKWVSIVAEYSKLEMTFECDKFNALAGMAALFSKALGDSPYLAGLWRTNLPAQLLWRTHERSERRDARQAKRARRPRTWIAPSWSWMSVDDEVKAGGSNHVDAFHCEVLECSTELATSSLPFGPIVSARLKLKGILRVAWLFPDTFVQSRNKNPHGDRLLMCRDRPRPLHDGKRNTRSSLGPLAEGGARLQADSYNVEHSGPGWVYCMAMRCPDSSTAVGFVFRRLGEVGNDFVRIGLFESLHPSIFKQTTQTIINVH